MTEFLNDYMLSETSLKAVDKLIAAHQRDSADSARFYYKVCDNYVNNCLSKDVLKSSFEKVSTEEEISHLKSNLQSLNKSSLSSDINPELKDAYIKLMKDEIAQKTNYHEAFSKDPPSLDIFSSDSRRNSTMKSDFEDFIDLQKEREQQLVSIYGRAIMEIAAGNETFAQNIVDTDLSKITPLLSDFDQNPANEFGYLDRYLESSKSVNFFEKLNHLAFLQDEENSLHESIFQNSAIHPFHEMLDQKFDGFRSDVGKRDLSLSDHNRLSSSTSDRLKQASLKKPAVLDRLDRMAMGDFLKKTVFLKTQLDWEKKISSVGRALAQSDLSAIKKNSHNEAFSISRANLVSKVMSNKIAHFHPDVLGSQLELDRVRDLTRLSQTVERNPLVSLLNKLPESAVSLSSDVVLKDIVANEKQKLKSREVSVSFER